MKQHSDILRNVGMLVLASNLGGMIAFLCGVSSIFDRMYSNTAVIFDFDGTLMDSIPNAFKAVCSIFEKSGVECPKIEEFITKFGDPFLDFYRRRGVTASDAEIWDWYHAAAGHESAKFFDDVGKVLGVLHEMHVQMAIVSANRQEILDLHCNGDLGCFFKVVMGKAFPKSGFIKTAALELGVDREHTYYVGDFVRDMEDSVLAGVIPIGITRGHPVRERLIAGGAKHCIDHLEELIPIITGKS